jgi:hypothetical protein
MPKRSKKPRALIIAALALFATAYLLGTDLPGFLRSDPAGDAMIGGCLVLVGFLGAGILVLIAGIMWWSSHSR